MIQKSSERYLLALKDRLKMIVIFGAIFGILGGLAGAYNSSKTNTEYTASVALLIGGPKLYMYEQVADYEKYQAKGRNSMNIFTNIVKSDKVMGDSISKFKLNDSIDKIQESFLVEPIGDTNMLKLRVNAERPELAIGIMEEILKESITRFEELNTMDSIDGINGIEVLDNIHVEKVSIDSNILPKVKFFTVLGLIISILTVILLECFNNVIKMPEDIEYNLELPILCSLSEGVESLKTYNILRTNIDNFNTDERMHTILVTSSSKDMNKSEVAKNLAISMAKIKDKVLLIDGDIREPEIHTFFNLENDIGLSNILKENIDYREAIQATGEENLWILPSGPRLSNPTELLLSEKLEQLLQELEIKYDFIVINSRFLGVTSDTVALSTFADGVLLTCTLGKTNIKCIKMSAKFLDKLNINLLGIVLA